MSELTVVNNPGQSRYEGRVDGTVAGFVRYVRHPNHLDLVHTEIAPEFEGRGLGGRLVKGALEDVRAHGGRVVASCPFVAAYLDKHPEYGDLVAV
jgi:predicted GNAT family acetyltransferase